MSELTPEEIARIREEERVRAEVRLEIAQEQQRSLQRSTSAKTIALWLVLVVAMFGIWKVFSKEHREPEAAQTEARQ